MTLNEFENALHTLLDDAVKSGLKPDDIQDLAEAIVNNTFLPDDCEENMPTLDELRGILKSN